MISCFSLRDFAQFSLQYFNVNDNSHINSESNILLRDPSLKKKKDKMHLVKRFIIIGSNDYKNKDMFMCREYIVN